MRKILLLAAALAGCTPAPAPSLPDGKNRVVDIVNTSDTPLQFSAMSAERRGLRHPSVTGAVEANGYLTLNFDNGSGACLFDFSAEFASGQSVEAAKFDVCHAASWVVLP